MSCTHTWPAQTGHSRVRPRGKRGTALPGEPELPPPPGGGPGPGPEHPSAPAGARGAHLGVGGSPRPASPPSLRDAAPPERCPFKLWPRSPPPRLPEGLRQPAPSERHRATSAPASLPADRAAPSPRGTGLPLPCPRCSGTMGCCTGRCTLIFLCTLQLVSGGARDRGEPPRTCGFGSPGRGREQKRLGARCPGQGCAPPQLRLGAARWRGGGMSGCAPGTLCCAWGGFTDA